MMPRTFLAAALLLAAPAFGQPTLATLCPEEDAPTEAEYANDPKAWADDFCALAWREPRKATAQLGKMIATTRARANGNRFYFPHSNAEPVQILRPWMADEGWHVLRRPQPNLYRPRYINSGVNPRVTTGRLALWDFHTGDGIEATLMVDWEKEWCREDHGCPLWRTRSVFVVFGAELVVEGHARLNVLIPTDKGAFSDFNAAELKCAVETVLDAPRPLEPTEFSYVRWDGTLGISSGYLAEGCEESAWWANGRVRAW